MMHIDRNHAGAMLRFFSAVSAEARLDRLEHTAKDQGALLRNFTKWDDEPRSPEGIVEAFLRSTQITRRAPQAPVYICLDAGLQEQRLTKPVKLPDAARFGPAEDPCAPQDAVDRIAGLLATARAPLILIGRLSQRQETGIGACVWPSFWGAGTPRYASARRFPPIIRCTQRLRSTGFPGDEGRNSQWT
jgi:hypothetical protein